MRFFWSNAGQSKDEQGFFSFEKKTLAALFFFFGEVGTPVPEPLLRTRNPSLFPFLRFPLKKEFLFSCVVICQSGGGRVPPNFSVL